jgi:hypothetical protein
VILCAVLTIGCHKAPALSRFRGVVRLGPDSDTFQPCGVMARWWLRLRPSLSAQWTMPGGALVEKVLSSQPRCLDIWCEPQVAYVEGSGEVGPGDYRLSESYEHSLEVARVEVAGREVPADCRQKGPPSDPPADGRVLDWRRFQEPVARCPLHGVPLSEGLVPVKHGKGAENEAVLDEADGVPFAVDYVAGGCGGGEDDPKVARVRFCEVCRRMKRARGR